MKKLEMNQMSNLQGGYACFFAIPFYVINVCTPGTSTNTTANRLVECWG